MITITYYEELAVASLRLLLISIGILICIEIIIKSVGRLRNSMIFFLVGFIPSTIYTIGKIINIEAITQNGNFLTLILNFLETLFILGGLWNILLLIKELSGETPKTKETRKQEYSRNARTSKDYPTAKKKKEKRRITIFR